MLLSSEWCRSRNYVLFFLDFFVFLRSIPVDLFLLERPSFAVGCSIFGSVFLCPGSCNDCFVFCAFSSQLVSTYRIEIVRFIFSTLVFLGRWCMGDREFQK